MSQIEHKAGAVVITGAAGDIGMSLSETFQSAGYYTIGLDLSADSYNCHVSLCTDLLSLAVSEQVRKKTRTRILAAADGLPITALINNAAIQRLGNIGNLTQSDWTDTINVNVLAPFFLVQLLLDHLRDASATIVNISSIHASLTKSGFAAYATSKAALIGLTRSMAVELAPEIRVNALAPAAIDTKMLRAGFGFDEDSLAALKSFHPTQSIGDPSEVATSALFLCSKKVRFLTGAILTLDGGISARLHDPS